MNVLDADAVRAQFLVSAGRLGKDQHSRTLIDDRSLFGHQVHAVENRIYQQYVIGPIGGQRAMDVLSKVKPGGFPGFVTEPGIDPGNGRPHQLQVLPVGVDVLSRRL